MSDWLFDAITRETDQLPAALRINSRGPGEIGIIPGEDRNARAASAAAVAARHNATILVYGVITAGDGGYQVEPEFYVSDRSFDYGSEVAGPEQLGQPIPIDMTPGPAGIFELNDKLNARRHALQHLVSGLAHFFIRRYDDAANDFQHAVKVDGWLDEEGKEVAYLLLGAAHLRAYDEITNPDPLLEAETAFAEAHKLNQDYGRSHLGRGAVALEQAKILNEDRTAIAGADEVKLSEASYWYSSSLRAKDQPALAYIPAKAAYGLGSVHLLGFETGVPGWSRVEAERFFKEVIAAYEAEPTPELAFYAARSYALLGRIEGHKRNYPSMSGKCHTAIEMLAALPGPGIPPRNLIARYWAWIGLAEKLVKHTENAREAYLQAIQFGNGSVSPQELERWQEELDGLE